MAQKRRQFTREFKLEAVRLVTEEGRKVSEVAQKLGIRSDMLRRWKQQAGSRSGPSGPELSGADVFPSHGKLTSQDDEIRKLRRELELVKQELSFQK